MPEPIRKRGDRGKSSLRQSHVARVIKGVTAAGIENARFEVDPHTGRISVFVGQGTPEHAGNDLDNWIAKRDAHQT